MRIIASTGVKGGVGKSTFAAILAVKLSNRSKVVLCDLDVECPNLHLLFKKELKDPKPIYWGFPKINEDLCKRCYACVSVCREHAIFYAKNKIPTILRDLCSGCMACKIACKNNAIYEDKTVVGEVFVQEINENLWLITGRSKEGLRETSIVVKEVKKFAVDFAKRINANYLVIDTAPGTHCVVTQALINCDEAYLVTEPTPLGTHDLSLAIELARKLGLNVKVVLNKANIGKKSLIDEILRKYGLKVHMEINYSQEIFDAYREGRIEEIVDKL